MSERPGFAVVLGASAGTGAAIARALARDPGLDVFAVHRGHHPDGARALEQEVAGLGRRVVLHAGDAGTAEGAAACAAALAEHAGPESVRVFVHSISGASIGHFLRSRGDAFRPRQVAKTFDYLAHSFVYWTQEIQERNLLAPGARLLGLTNTLHESLIDNTGLVAAAKAALEMYVRQLAIELGPLGHRVNLLKFGTVMTPALRTVLGADAMEHIEAVHRKMIPAGRMCSVQEVGCVVSLLARDEAAWFNGATIDFTGGVTLRLMDVLFRGE